MRVCCLLLAVLTGLAQAGEPAAKPVNPAGRKVFILPIREDIMPPLVYLVRRGVKEAMEAKANLLVIDMKTDGGRVDTTEEIIEIINKFPGETVTYVNNRAFSAGSFISAGTQKIYMAPQSVIGAAAPVMMSPTGDGVQGMPDSVRAKMVSAISALVRATAEKNGHPVDVLEAMIDETRELKRVEHVKQPDGSVTTVTNLLNEKGRLLTLTDKQAAMKYGDPPRPLLSLGTMENLDALLAELGYAGAERQEIQATGAEQLGFWLNAISPLLLMIGIIGFYMEFKTPGFGVPGIAAIAAFALYFLGGYVAGLSGLEWIAVFLLGVVLLALELFAFPGTIVPGLVGAALILVALVMAMVDVYPGAPSLPSLPQLQIPVRQLVIGFAGGIAAVLLLGRLLPKTPVYRTLVSESASGVQTEQQQREQRAVLQGQVGITVSSLRPGGKAQFGDQILDVISQGDLVSKGTRVRIIGFSGAEALVEVAKEG